MQRDKLVEFSRIIYVRLIHWLSMTAEAFDNKRWRAGETVTLKERERERKQRTITQSNGNYLMELKMKAYAMCVFVCGMVLA